MTSGTIFEVLASTSKGNINIKLSFDHADFAPSEIKFSLMIDTGSVSSSSDIRSSLVIPTVSVNLLIVDVINDPMALCLLACVGGAVVKPIIECFDKDVQQYLKCLKSKGLGMAAEAVACAIECASK